MKHSPEIATRPATLRTQTLRALPLLAIPLLALSSLNAQAYNWSTCPAGGPIDYNSGHMTFNYGNDLSTAQKTALSLGHARTTAFSDSSITTIDNGDNDFFSGNGENEIYLNAAEPTAVCSTWLNPVTCVVTEADMQYGSQTWTTTDNSAHFPYANGRSMTATAIHESGHCIGMAHSNDIYNMMGSDFSHVTRQGTDAYYGPGEDLSNGLIDLHGEKSGGSDTHRDVGISVMRYSGVSGPYSVHDFGQLRDLAGTPLPIVGSYVGQALYRVVAGATIQMETTAENNGELDTENPSVGIYLSDNDIISGTDVLITQSIVPLTRDTPLEAIANVVIPSNTIAGNYFLGAYIDNDDTITETTAANNYAYYPLTVIGAPDVLSLSPGVSDATLNPSQLFTVSATVMNDGSLSSNATTLRYYVSTDATITTADTFLGASSIGSLGTGASSGHISPSVSIATSGSYWVGACVDLVSGEGNTSNQCTTGVSVAVLPPGC
ncbi:MAG: hypothetical protein ACI9JM_002928 [Halioglobus sp.]|jgi:hypothetical protein